LSEFCLRVGSVFISHVAGDTEQSFVCGRECRSSQQINCQVLQNWIVLVIGQTPSQRVDLVVGLLFVPPPVEVVVDIRTSADVAVRRVVIHLLAREHRRGSTRYQCTAPLLCCGISAFNNGCGGVAIYLVPVGFKPVLTVVRMKEHGRNVWLGLGWHTRVLCRLADANTAS
jgi:hypothetical protein